LLVGIVLTVVSVTGWVVLIAADPTHYLQQGDAVVYRDAGAAALRGDPIYGTGFGPIGLPFTYPPFAALLFAPVSMVPFGGWQMLLLAAGLVSVILTVQGSLRLAGRSPVERSPGDRRRGALARASGHDTSSSGSSIWFCSPLS
jgi:alpha-1,2-mannosyltransferase